MNFITYNQMVQDLLAWELPRDIDIVAAVPRSGMIPASVLALKWNVSLTTVDQLREGKVMIGGFRDQNRHMGKVLVLDDSCLTGKSLARACQGLEEWDIYRAAVYCSPGKEFQLDYYCKLLDTPRIFEWNWPHHYWIQNGCVDIDGVLCRDPTKEENDDGPRYLRFLEQATPHYLPTVEIGCLVTNRLECYRMPTEKWLAKHNIKYKKLIMHPAKTRQERVRMGNHSKHKARVYSQNQYGLFVESSERQAREINRLTGKPVLCTDMMEMYV